ncbi:Ultraviolet-B receptor uvr8 [Actinomortierella wolfii]|nr:Ultraviolet-B receptor uvr8 [Actinomortierella wolfii]
MRYGSMLGLSRVPSVTDVMGMKIAKRVQLAANRQDVSPHGAQDQSQRLNTQDDASDIQTELEHESDESQGDEDEHLMKRFEGKHEDIRDITLSGMLRKHLVLSDSEDSDNDSDAHGDCTKRSKQNHSVTFDFHQPDLHGNNNTVVERLTSYLPSDHNDNSESGDGANVTTIVEAENEDIFYDNQNNRTVVFMSNITSAMENGNMSLLPLDRAMNVCDLPNYTLLADYSYLDCSGKSNESNEATLSAKTDHSHNHPAGKKTISFLAELNDFCSADILCTNGEDHTKRSESHLTPASIIKIESMDVNMNIPANHAQPNRSHGARRPTPIITRDLLHLPKTHHSVTSNQSSQSSSPWSVPSICSTINSETLISSPPLASASTQYSVDSPSFYVSAREFPTSVSCRNFPIPSPFTDSAPPAVPTKAERTAIGLVQQEDPQQYLTLQPSRSTIRATASCPDSFAISVPQSTLRDHHGGNASPLDMIVIAPSTLSNALAPTVATAGNSDMGLSPVTLKARSMTCLTQLQSGWLGFLPLKTRFVASGARHSVLVTDSGEVYSWWWEEEGKASMESKVATSTSTVTPNTTEDNVHDTQMERDVISWRELVLGRSTTVDNGLGFSQDTTSRPGLVFEPLSSPGVGGMTEDTALARQEATIKKVACADHASFVLISSGELWGWGTFKANEGEVITWGSNDSGQLGRECRWDLTKGQELQVEGKDGEKRNPSMTLYDLIPFFVSGLSSNKILGIGAGKEATYCWDEATLYGWGDTIYSPVATDNDAPTVVPHRRHGFVPSTRLNAHGRRYLELPTVIPLSWRGTALKQVQGGARHTVILTKSGLVLTMGDNTFGQLGTSPPDTTTAMTATTTTTNTANATMAAGSSPADHQSPIRSLPTLVRIGTGIKEISCGAYHTVACTETGHGFIWGKGYQGTINLIPSPSYSLLAMGSPYSSSSTPTSSSNSSLSSSSSSPSLAASLLSSGKSRRRSNHAVAIGQNQRIMHVSALAQGPLTIALVTTEYSLSVK